MNVSIRQIHPVFVGEVSGIDISRPLSRDEIAAVEAGMDRYAVLVFHDQKLTDEEQMAFSRNFGPLEDARGGNITKPEDKRLQVGMNDVSNLGKDGRSIASLACACSTSATCSGTRTARSVPFPRSTRCSRRAW